MSKHNLTADYLKSLFDYSCDTGVFTRKISRNNKYKVGSIAGCTNAQGYKTIQIDGITYLAHRLAWLYVYGHFPKSMIDHINGIRTDNKIQNLRDVTNSVNMQNRKASNRDSKSLLLGVSPASGKWVANIKVNGEIHYLGFFESKEIAHNAYIDAKRILHEGCTI